MKRPIKSTDNRDIKKFDIKVDKDFIKKNIDIIETIFVDFFIFV